MNRLTTDNRALPGNNPLYRSTFVGRETELKQLKSAFDAANALHDQVGALLAEIKAENAKQEGEA